ncbi:juvenile hormone esterase-like [Zophobas morio]|uniref:juvenile hormone esterase-like n=1 Tax=Zophobas morio TaxID=2755281 RepID=UPI003082F3D3
MVNKVLLLLCFLQAVTKLTISHRNQPTVETSHGRIKGTILRTRQPPHSQYYAFKGIPYAKPPLNHLRFKPPQNPNPWNGVKPCQKFGNPCLQISKTDGSVIGSEDCLTLNVFTNELDVTRLKPVMFWIHGGAHLRGSGSLYGPDYLVEKPIVLVTVNFRLNVFGFLTVNDENAYGNTGIKDQVAALKWVRDNIAKFGGDASRVTIFGESSGANCVSLLQLCPRTKGLYHQVIVQSGSALNSRYLQRNPLKYVYNIANYFNVSSETTKTMVEGLQTIDAKELTKVAHNYKAMRYTQNLQAGPFYPVIEVDNPGAIITDSPFELMKSGKLNPIPFIAGYNTDEGTLGLKIVNSTMNISDFDEKYELFAPRSLNNEDNQVSIGKVVRGYFLGNSSATNVDKLSKFLGQELLVRGIRKQADFQRQYSRGYFYRFGYKGTNTAGPGVGHAEELQYLFKQEAPNEVTDQDILTRRRMVEMWTNFAIFGSPLPDDTLVSENVSWKECQSSGPLNFLKIGTSVTQGTNPDDQTYRFWKELFNKFGVEPYQTY